MTSQAKDIETRLRDEIERLLNDLQRAVSVADIAVRGVAIRDAENARLRAALQNIAGAVRFEPIKNIEIARVALENDNG